MASIEDLYNVYQSFCAFGSSKNLSSPAASSESLSGPLMDGKFYP